MLWKSEEKKKRKENQKSHQSPMSKFVKQIKIIQYLKTVKLLFTQLLKVSYLWIRVGQIFINPISSSHKHNHTTFQTFSQLHKALIWVLTIRQHAKVTWKASKAESYTNKIKKKPIHNSSCPFFIFGLDVKAQGKFEIHLQCLKDQAFIYVFPQTTV